MRKIVSIFIFCMVIGGFVFAQAPQQKGLDVISRTSAEAYIGFLASDELEGREAGTRGGRIAGEYIASILADMGMEAPGGTYFHPFEAYNRERQKRQRFQVDPDSIAVIKKEVHQKLSLNNIFGMIEGKRKDEIVIVGAHYDHLGLDPFLTGDQIYNGADDNASGVSAVLQIARAFKATGIQPERTVIFAFWDGEEKGLLGSKFFTGIFPGIDQVKAYMNFDMIGRNQSEDRPEHVVYFYTDTHPVFEKWLREEVSAHGLTYMKPDCRAWDNPISGSDNASFAIKNIPIIWYHTDGHPDYHMPGDHTDKLNWDKLLDITRSAFLVMWRLANENF